MELLEVRITLLLTRLCNCTCWSNYGNGIGTNNFDTIDEVDETLTLLMER
jgi:hypothetical protein